MAQLAILAAVIGAVLATRWGLRSVLKRLTGGLRTAAGDLVRVAWSPAKLARVFGGSAGVTLAYIAALAASVTAFGGTVSLAQIGSVYLASSAIAAEAPTPGGLGPLEAALVAGLTGVGMASGPAVSAVLTYRLATYGLADTPRVAVIPPSPAVGVRVTRGSGAPVTGPWSTPGHPGGSPIRVMPDA